MRNLRIWILVITSLLLLLSVFTSANTTDSISVFDSRECEHCIHLRKKIFRPIQKVYPQLEIVYYDLKYPENYQLLINYLHTTTRQKVDISKLPIVFVGSEVLAGKEDVRANFEKVVTEYVLSKNVISEPDKTKVITQKLGKVHLAYFYEPGCEKCRLLDYMFNYLGSKYPELEVRRYNIWEKKNKKLAEAICILLNVPDDLRLLTPAIFIGDNFMIKDIDPLNVERLIRQYGQTEGVPIWERAAGLETLAVDGIIHRFNTFKIPIILGAGVLDGINPCAFGIIVFLIIHLTTLKRTKREVLIAGLSFISAVYFSYLCLGFGLYEFLTINFILIFKKVFYTVGAGVCLILCIYSLRDYFIWKKEGYARIKLQLPEMLKKKAYTTIVEKSRMRNIFIATFLSGIVISFIEIVCTGQIYLPTILFVISISHLRTKGVAYLLLYNLAFILPLFAVFILVYKGLSTDYLIGWIRKNLGKVKIMLGVIFIIFAFILLFSAF